MEKATIEDFSKLDLRVGEILSAEEHPNASKLLILKVDFGEEIGERTIVAGLKNYYKIEELEGKKAIFIVNLEPANLRGVESNGMILAASNSDKSEVRILIPKENVNQGSRVKFDNIENDVQKEGISINDFNKVDLRVGEVKKINGKNILVSCRDKNASLKNLNVVVGDKIIVGVLEEGLVVPIVNGEIPLVADGNLEVGSKVS